MSDTPPDRTAHDHAVTDLDLMIALLALVRDMQDACHAGPAHRPEVQAISQLLTQLQLELLRALLALTE